MTTDAATSGLFEETEGSYVEVAVPVPLRRLFTYRVPPALADHVAVGTRVAVPFSGRKLAAIVLGHRDGPPEGVKRVRDVAGVLETEPVFTDELLDFLRQAAEYYLHPLGEVLKSAAPALPAEAMRTLRDQGFLAQGESLPGRRAARRRTVLVARPTGGGETDAKMGKRQRAVLTLLQERAEVTVEELRDHVREPRDTLRRLADRGLVELEEREVLADPFFGTPVPREAGPEPNEAQQSAIAAITAALPEGPQQTTAPPGSGTVNGFLLHGVTGSGKTEVYLRVIAEASRRGLGALLLVPEIALTPQLVARFRARFGDAIAVLHSGLADRERDDAWRRLRRGDLSIAVGARSALFAPIRNPGIVVVDEEHDPSFKQEEGFRYHARDMALLRAHRAGAVCVLGSATPSVESYHLTERGKLNLLTLPSRATSQQLPDVELVDLRRHRSGPSGHALLSAPLHRALEQCLSRQEQAILFLNRRGFAPSIRCVACGAIMECPACSVALTEHRKAGVLRCHYCDYSTPPGDRCGECGAEAIERVGLGTEQLEETLNEHFAPARIARLDRDTATGRSLEKVLDRLRRREIDVLVGTQMVTKGHDLPGVTLVGVVLADQPLSFPDFRAGERTFQLLAQVAGRAGRGEHSGRVLFQTFQPEHPAVRAAAAHDYDTFYRHELGERRELGYSPFSRLIAVRVDAGDEGRGRAAARELARVARAQEPVREGHVQVLGPAPAPIARLRGRWRFRVMMRGPDRRRLRHVGLAVVRRIDEGLSPARAQVDVDPVSML